MMLKNLLIGFFLVIFLAGSVHAGLTITYPTSGTYQQAPTYVEFDVARNPGGWFPWCHWYISWLDTCFPYFYGNTFNWEYWIEGGQKIPGGTDVFFDQDCSILRGTSICNKLHVRKDIDPAMFPAGTIKILHVKTWRSVPVEYSPLERTVSITIPSTITVQPLTPEDNAQVPFPIHVSLKCLDNGNPVDDCTCSFQYRKGSRNVLAQLGSAGGGVYEGNFNENNFDAGTRYVITATCAKVNVPTNKGSASWAFTPVGYQSPAVTSVSAEPNSFVRSGNRQHVKYTINWQADNNNAPIATALICNSNALHPGDGCTGLNVCTKSGTLSSSPIECETDFVFNDANPTVTHYAFVCSPGYVQDPTKCSAPQNNAVDISLTGGGGGGSEPQKTCVFYVDLEGSPITINVPGTGGQNEFSTADVFVKCLENGVKVACPAFPPYVMEFNKPTGNVYWQTTQSRYQETGSKAGEYKNVLIARHSIRSPVTVSLASRSWNGQYAPFNCFGEASITIGQQTPTPEFSCTDSEASMMGLNPPTYKFLKYKGVVTANSAPSDVSHCRQSGEYWICNDYCLTNNDLVDYYCIGSPRQPSQTTYSCSGIFPNHVCNDGKCVASVASPTPTIAPSPIPSIIPANGCLIAPQAATIPQGGQFNFVVSCFDAAKKRTDCPAISWATSGLTGVTKNVAGSTRSVTLVVPVEAIAPQNGKLRASGTFSEPNPALPMTGIAEAGASELSFATAFSCEIPVSIESACINGWQTEQRTLSGTSREEVTVGKYVFKLQDLSPTNATVYAGSKSGSWNLCSTPQCVASLGGNPLLMPMTAVPEELEAKVWFLQYIAQPASVVTTPVANSAGDEASELSFDSSYPKAVLKIMSRCEAVEASCAVTPNYYSAAGPFSKTFTVAFKNIFGDAVVQGGAKATVYCKQIAASSETGVTQEVAITQQGSGGSASFTCDYPSVPSDATFFVNVVYGATKCGAQVQDKKNGTGGGEDGVPQILSPKNGDEYWGERIALKYIIPSSGGGAFQCQYAVYGGSEPAKFSEAFAAQPNVESSVMMTVKPGGHWVAMRCQPIASVKPAPWRTSKIVRFKAFEADRPIILEPSSVYHHFGLKSPVRVKYEIAGTSPNYACTFVLDGAVYSLGTVRAGENSFNANPPLSNSNQLWRDGTEHFLSVRCAPQSNTVPIATTAVAAASELQFASEISWPSLRPGEKESAVLKFKAFEADKPVILTPLEAGTYNSPTELAFVIGGTSAAYACIPVFDASDASTVYIAAGEVTKLYKAFSSGTHKAKVKCMKTNYAQISENIAIAASASEAFFASNTIVPPASQWVSSVEVTFRVINKNQPVIVSPKQNELLLNTSVNFTFTIGGDALAYDCKGVLKSSGITPFQKDVDFGRVTRPSCGLPGYFSKIVSGLPLGKYEARVTCTPNYAISCGNANVAPNEGSGSCKSVTLLESTQQQPRKGDYIVFSNGFKAVYQGYSLTWEGSRGGYFFVSTAFDIMNSAGNKVDSATLWVNYTNSTSPATSAPYVKNGLKLSMLSADIESFGKTGVWAMNFEACPGGVLVPASPSSSPTPTPTASPTPKPSVSPHPLTCNTRYAYSENAIRTLHVGDCYDISLPQKAVDHGSPRTITNKLVGIKPDPEDSGRALLSFDVFYENNYAWTIDYSDYFSVPIQNEVTGEIDARYDWYSGMTEKTFHPTQSCTYTNWIYYDLAVTKIGAVTGDTMSDSVQIAVNYHSILLEGVEPGDTMVFENHYFVALNHYTDHSAAFFDVKNPSGSKVGEFTVTNQGPSSYSYSQAGINANWKPLTVANWNDGVVSGGIGYGACSQPRSGAALQPNALTIPPGTEYYDWKNPTLAKKPTSNLVTLPKASAQTAGATELFFADYTSDPVNFEVGSGAASPTPTPSATPTPSVTPEPSVTPTPSPTVGNGGGGGGGGGGYGGRSCNSNADCGAGSVCVGGYCAGCLCITDGECNLCCIAGTDKDCTAKQEPLGAEPTLTPEQSNFWPTVTPVPYNPQYDLKLKCAVGEGADKKVTAVLTVNGVGVCDENMRFNVDGKNLAPDASTCAGTGTHYFDVSGLAGGEFTGRASSLGDSTASCKITIVSAGGDWLLWLVLALVVIAVAGGAYYYYNKRKQGGSGGAGGDEIAAEETTDLLE